MKSIEFVKSELSAFIHQFPKTRVRLEIDTDSKSHYVEIVPNEVYNLDSNYIVWESEVFDNFIEKFPDENIYFISDDALVGLDRIDFELIGIAYKSILSINNEFVQNINQIVNWINIKNLPVFSGLSTYRYDTEIISGSFGSSISSSYQNTITELNDFSSKTVNTKLEPEFENSFPLAA
jgi:hypothetical protein